ncbi:tyrosine recombinase [Bacteroidia bacterium]|nr:tyrosine recombinase [Bacteroidia bacterium]
MEKQRSTFKLLFYINTSKTKKNDKCPIVGRISIDGKSTAFSTGIDVLPADWDSNKGIAKSNITINRKLDDFGTETAKHYKNMLETKGYVTAESLKNALRGIGVNQNSLMQEFSAYLEEKRKSIGIRFAESSYKLYNDGYRHLRTYLIEKLGVDDIPFGKVDIALIEDYSYYLKIELRMAAFSVRAFMKPFRTTVRRAFNKGLLLQDPFLDYTFEKDNTKRRWLSKEEIERLIKTDIKRASTSFIRNMFLFSTFTGLAYSDLKNLQHSNIQEQKDGSKWIVINRQKTGTASYIPLLKIPLAILEKYRDTKFSGSDGKIFKMRTLVNMNVQLKEIAKAAGIDKPLSFHLARHSFATTVCLTNGIPIETLSQMMGHLSIKTTQIYAKVTRTKLNEDMTNLAERIEGKYKLADSDSNNIKAS